MQNKNPIKVGKATFVGQNFPSILRNLQQPQKPFQYPPPPKKAVKCTYDYNVGDFVYEAYGANKPAKVIDHLGDACASKRWTSYGVTSLVRIKFLNGTTKECCSIHLSSFNALIADHQKKLKTHTDKLPKLAAL